MSGAPLLVANLGGEEERAPSGASARKTAAASALWRLLFAREARAPQAWPGALGPEPAGAAFPWLEVPGEAVAWLVTEAAREQAASQGRRLAGPAPEVVRRVHDKAFALEAAGEQGFEPRSLVGAWLALEPEELADEARALERIVAAMSGWPAWLGARPRAVLKPRFGSSGRGRLAFSDLAELGGALAPLAERGGAVLEPWLEREGDLSVQLHVTAEGLLLLGTLEQRLTPGGVPRGLVGTLDRRGRVTSDTPHDEPLREAAVAIAECARRAGYTGPCGVDAFAFRGPEGNELRPVVELNARFTLGTVAVGLARRVRERAVEHFGLDANERLHFRLDLDSGDPPASDDVLRLSLAESEAEPRAELWLARERGLLG